MTEKVIGRVEADAILEFQYGSHEQPLLIEAKSGSNDLDREQWGKYLDVLNEDQEAVLLTITNRMATARHRHPNPHESVLRSPEHVQERLRHMSWSEVITRAGRAAKETDTHLEARLLEDLAEYLVRNDSGAAKMDRLPGSWSRTVRKAGGRSGPTELEARELAITWLELLHFQCLDLTREGLEVEVIERDRTALLDELAEEVVSERTLRGTLRVTDGMASGGVAQIDIWLGLASRELLFDVTAPLYGNGTADRVNRFVRAAEDLGLEDVAVGGFGAQQAPDAAAKGNFRTVPDTGRFAVTDSLPRLTNGTGRQESMAQLFRTRVSRVVLDDLGGCVDALLTLRR